MGLGECEGVSPSPRLPGKGRDSERRPLRASDPAPRATLYIRIDVKVGIPLFSSLDQQKRILRVKYEN